MKYIALDGPTILRGDPALVLLGIRALGGVFLYVMHTMARGGRRILWRKRTPSAHRRAGKCRLRSCLAGISPMPIKVKAGLRRHALRGSIERSSKAYTQASRCHGFVPQGV